MPTGREGSNHTPTRNPSPWLTRIYRHHVKVRARDQGNLQACSFYATKNDQRHPQCETLHTATTLLTRFKGTQSARLNRDHPSEQLKHQNTGSGRAILDTFGPFKIICTKEGSLRSHSLAGGLTEVLIVHEDKGIIDETRPYASTANFFFSLSANIELACLIDDKQPASARSLGW